MAVKSLLCGFNWEGFSAEHGCVSPVFFGGKITASHLAIYDPHGWNLLLEDTVVINQPALASRPPELSGEVVTEETGRKEGGFCREEMTNVLDGLSEAGSGHNRGAQHLGVQGSAVVPRGLSASSCPAVQGRSGVRVVPMASGGLADF